MLNKGLLADLQGATSNPLHLLNHLAPVRPKDFGYAHSTAAVYEARSSWPESRAVTSAPPRVQLAPPTATFAATLDTEILGHEPCGLDGSRWEAYHEEYMEASYHEEYMEASLETEGQRAPGHESGAISRDDLTQDSEGYAGVRAAWPQTAAAEHFACEPDTSPWAASAVREFSVEQMHC